MEKYKSERERRLKNRDYVYTIQNPKQDVFFVKGDEGIIRVNTPLNDGRGNGFCIMEFDKKDIISNPNGSYSVYFNENDMFKMYSYDEINNDGTLSESASPRTIMADYLKSSTYTAINFKERQDKQDGMGMEFKNDTRMRKQV